MDLFVASPNDFEMWKEERLVLDVNKGLLVSHLTLDRKDLDAAIYRYDRNGNMFWKAWDDLTEYEQSVWLTSWMANWKDPDRYWSYSEYSKCGAYFDHEAVSPEGEPMVIFGQVT